MVEEKKIDKSSIAILTGILIIVAVIIAANLYYGFVNYDFIVEKNECMYAPNDCLEWFCNYKVRLNYDDPDSRMNDFKEKYYRWCLENE